MTDAGLSPSPEDVAFLAGGGELAGRIARYDWATTPLGLLSDWPPSRRAALALVLRAAVPIVTAWGESGVLLYNDAFAALVAHQHPGLLGMEIRRAWPTEGSFLDSVMRSVLAGRTLSFRSKEFKSDRDGMLERIWLDLDYSPILDERGRPAGVMAIVADTTAKVRADRKLQDERQRLQQMFEQAPGLTAMLEGPGHVFTLANAAFIGFVGREVLGLTFEEALPEIARQGFVAALDETRRTGTPFVGHGVPVMLDRTPGAALVERYVDFVFQPITADDGTTGIFAQCHDVTERHRAGEALRESEARFRLVAETAPVMLWMGDPEGRCVYLNAAQRAFWGVASNANAPFDWSSTLHPDDRAWIDRSFARALRDHTSFAVEARYRRSDGEYRTIGTTAHPRFGADHAFLGMIGVNIDVTDARRNEAALTALNETLGQRVSEETAERSKAEAALREAQKMEAIGRLTGGVAHDFNNLLQIVSGTLQLLGRDLEGNERALARIADAMASVRQGAKLTGQLLAFGRRQPLDPRVTDIGQLVAGMRELIAHTIGDGVQVEARVADDLWTTLVDPVQLETAVLNLAANARDAMGGVGQLTIDVRNALVDKADARAATDLHAGQYVLLTVTDTGPGIAPEIMDRVFEPFFSTKPRSEATGLGLSTVYGFVKQSGGNVGLESDATRGTSVSLYLPRADRSEERRPAPAPGSPAPGRRTILLAEDNDAVRETTVGLLSDLGYRVMAARDAASALGILESGVPVDLLFVDAVMPGRLQSPELARLARELHPGIAVLFTSGYVGAGSEPGLDLIPKPYTREGLAQAVAGLLAAERNAASA
ncbi:MAG: PAS domain S-box protein [Amaricoccus sp.]